MNTCNFTKAPLRDYYADLWRNIAEAILGCVFSHWGLKVCKPKIISDLFTVTAFIFWIFLTLFLSLVCIQHPLPCPCPWAKSQHHNIYKCCQVTPNNILAAIMPAICSNPAATKLHYGGGMYGHGRGGSITHLEIQRPIRNRIAGGLSHLSCLMKITSLFWDQQPYKRRNNLAEKRWRYLTW